MHVRLARPTDAPLALALALDDKAHLVRSSGWPPSDSVSRTMLRALAPLTVPGRTWIVRDGSVAGILEAQPRRYVIGWDITRLAIRGPCDRVLGALIREATDHIRARGVPRLFARCGDEAATVLKSCGLAPLAREYVLVGPEGEVEGEEELPMDSRYRMPQDAWPLHQLESEVTPPLVRQLEGLTSLDWSNKVRGMSEIVVEQEGRVVAWIGWGVRLRKGYNQIGMLVHPDFREIGPELLAHALKTAPAGSRFVARVRDYHRELLTVFGEAGFQVAAEEILMVKHARVEAVPARAKRVKVAPVPSVHTFQNRMNGVGEKPA